MRAEEKAETQPAVVNVAELITQEILRQPEQLAQSFMNAPNVGVAICDLQFRFRGINEALAVINGVPSTEHYGQSIHEVLGEFADKIVPLFNHVIVSGQPLLNVHLTGILPGRKETGHWIENYFPLKDERGRVNRICAMVIEVTEQRKLEESLRLLNAVCRDGANQLKTLVEFHKQLIAKPDPGALAGAVTAFVNRLIPHDYAMLTLEDDVMRLLGMDRKDIVGVEGWDWKGSLGPAPEAATGSGELGGLVVRPRDSGWEQMLKQGIESAISLPLVTQRGKLGTLHLANRRRGAFQKVDRELAEQVAMHVALAVDYACSSKEIESLKHRLAEPKISVETNETKSDVLRPDRTLRMVERDYIVQALRGTRGKVAGASGAAVKLGMKRTTLQSRIQKLKIERSEYLDDGKASPKRQVS